MQKIRHWKEKQWRKVVYLAEYRLLNTRGAKVKRPSSVSQYKQCYNVLTVKHSARVMVWDCFSGSRKQGSYFFPKNMTQ